MRRIVLVVLVMLFAIAGCGSTPTGRPPSVWSSNTCSTGPGCTSPPLVPSDLSGIVGPSGKAWPQGLLVQRGSQVYALILYLVQRRDGSKILVDPIGQTYTSLDNFREDNTLLTPEDKISAPGDVMTPHSTGTISTTGHVEPSTPWWPWLLGGVVVLVIIVLAVWWALSRRRSVPEQAPEHG